jgi:hypothetical protein
VRTAALGTSVNTVSFDTTNFEFICNTTKTFIIDHPLDEEKYLVHGCVEGPESGVYYRGKAHIHEGAGEVVVELPEYVRAFADFTVHVSKVVKEKKDLSLCGASQVADGKFSVFGEDGEYHYLVFGKREDLVVEPLKSDKAVKRCGPYTWFE